MSTKETFWVVPLRPSKTRVYGPYETLEEARANLQEAVTLVLEANRALAQEDAPGSDVIREPLKVRA